VEGVVESGTAVEGVEGVAVVAGVVEPVVVGTAVVTVGDAVWVSSVTEQPDKSIPAINASRTKTVAKRLVFVFLRILIVIILSYMNFYLVSDV
jgi:hypothetical protein